MTVELVQDSTSLMSLGRRLETAPFIALDTEFMRSRTFYAQLCLIQIAAPGIVACVDPLALAGSTAGDDKETLRSALGPLLEVVYRSNVPKVLHAARQDLEVLADLCGALPAPLFDTQIAAALLGHDDQIGYSALVESMIGVRLAKLHTRTDWAARPLGAEQLAYAADDVRYLCRLQPLLAEQLAALGRLDWLQEEMDRLADPLLYRSDPETAYRRLGAGATLPARVQVVLAELAAWRESTAKAQDLPRGWVVKDAVLVEIARRAPVTRRALEDVEGMPAGAARRWGRDIVATVERARRAPAHRMWEPPIRLDSTQQLLYKRMNEHVKRVAGEQGICPALLATRQDLQRLISGRASAVTSGWRRKIVGGDLIAMCRAVSTPPSPMAGS